MSLWCPSRSSFEGSSDPQRFMREEPDPWQCRSGRCPQQHPQPPLTVEGQAHRLNTIRVPGPRIVPRRLARAYKEGPRRAVRLLVEGETLHPHAGVLNGRASLQADCGFDSVTRSVSERGRLGGPAFVTIWAVADLVAHLLWEQGAAGSNPRPADSSSRGRAACAQTAFRCASRRMWPVSMPMRPAATTAVPGAISCVQTHAPSADAASILSRLP